MGASTWSYYVPYQRDLSKALHTLQDEVFASGDYWWAVPGEIGKSAADFPDRPRTEQELWAAESVQEDGTHSILDMSHVIPAGTDDGPGTVEPVTSEQALAATGTALPTREHAKALSTLASQRWYGRCAVLHDASGAPTEIYFFGFSGD